jgi:hypothetical protein
MRMREPGASIHHVEAVDSKDARGCTLECSHRDSLHKLCSPQHVAAARRGSARITPSHSDRQHRMRRPDRVPTVHV